MHQCTIFVSPIKEKTLWMFFFKSFLVFSAYKSRESFKISLSVGLMGPLQTDPNCLTVLSHWNQQYSLKYTKRAFHHNFLDLNLLKMTFNKAVKYLNIVKGCDRYPWEDQINWNTLLFSISYICMLIYLLINLSLNIVERINIINPYKNVTCTSVLYVQFA